MPRISFESLTFTDDATWIHRTRHPNLHWHGFQAVDMNDPEAPAAVGAAIANGTAAAYKPTGVNVARITAKFDFDPIKAVLATEAPSVAGMTVVGRNDGAVVARQALTIEEMLTPTLFRFGNDFDGIDKLVFRWRASSPSSDEIAPDLAMDNLYLQHAHPEAGAAILIA